MLVLYYGYIAIVAFAPALIATKVERRHHRRHHHGRRADPALHRPDRDLVLRANSRYDDLTRAIVRSATGAARERALPLAAPLALLASPAFAAEAIEAGARQETNWTAILIFGAFVLLTLGITYWAARRTRTAKDFYAAGGGVSGFQNGLAIAGDYMSAASFLGISAAVSRRATTG